MARRSERPTIKSAGQKSLTVMRRTATRARRLFDGSPAERTPERAQLRQREKIARTAETRARKRVEAAGGTWQDFVA